MALFAELVRNGDFEEGALRPTTASPIVRVANDDAATIPYWKVFVGMPAPVSTEAPVAWVHNNNEYKVKTLFGDRFLDLTGFRDRPATDAAGVRQMLETEPGRRYKLTFHVGTGAAQEFQGPAVVKVAALCNTFAVLYADAVNPGGIGDRWTRHEFTFITTTNATELIFAGTVGKKLIGLDYV